MLVFRVAKEVDRDSWELARVEAHRCYVTIHAADFCAKDRVE
jgi:hypothetical protein